MKKLEDLFKSALRDQELPYNEGAWNQMSKKLDARSGGASGNLNWILGAAGVLVVAVGTLLYFNGNNGSNIQENKEKSIASLETKSIENTNSNDIDSDELISENQVQEDNATENSNNEVKVKTKITSKETNPEEVVQIIECCDEKVVRLIPPVYRETTLVEVSEEINTAKEDVLTYNILIDKCLNDEFVYSNKNNKSIWINTPSNRLIEIPGLSLFRETLQSKGIYHVGALNEAQEFVSKQSFTVFEAKSSQLLVEDHLNYENGLPQLVANSYSEGDNTWYVNDEAVSSNRKENSFNLFKKGSYNISLSTKDHKGCTSVSNVTFNVEEDYNLLAVNAFTPSSLDTRNRFFIPFALTQRGTPFHMIVIDPADGAILFETSTADQPWDGIDRNTGKMVDENKSYVWKVILDQPESNEKPEYLGTVVRL
ncbi:MAG: hypothetical protein MUQ75_08000 [Crocinitomicaceae bacterium]|nr:hypothetical protein [Crocinitomicaceae bacterium]